jgi:hypothetical protein
MTRTVRRDGARATCLTHSSETRALIGRSRPGCECIRGSRRRGRAKGSGADKPRAAKLVPRGTANAVERDGERGATWEVEVKRGRLDVDIRLDANYQLVVIDPDSEKAGGN